MSALKRVATFVAIVIIPFVVSACSQTMDLTDSVKSMVTPSSWSNGHYSSRDKECLMRAMFFESNRSSREGLIAVGTVVMNRLRSGKHGNTICEVVGAKRQFAPGVMTRRMNSKSLPDVEAAADAVLRGERNAKVKNAMFFHTAGLKFPYKNMHYTVVAGGNAFYEKRGRKGEPVVLPPEGSYSQPVMVAEAKIRRPGVEDSTLRTADAAPANATPVQVAEAAPMVVAEAELPEDALPMAINGPTPSARPLAGQQIAAAFPPTPVAPVQAVRAATIAPNAPAPEDLPFGVFDEAVTTTESQSSMADAPPTMASFNVDPDDASAIGAMLVDQDGPIPSYN